MGLAGNVSQEIQCAKTGQGNQCVRFVVTRNKINYK